MIDESFQRWPHFVLLEKILFCIFGFSSTPQTEHLQRPFSTCLSSQTGHRSNHEHTGGWVRYGHSKQGKNRENLVNKATQMQAFNTQSTKYLSNVFQITKKTRFFSLLVTAGETLKSPESAVSLHSFRTTGLAYKSRNPGLAGAAQTPFSRPKRKKSPETLHLRPRPNRYQW